MPGEVMWNRGFPRGTHAGRGVMVVLRVTFWDPNDGVHSLIDALLAVVKVLFRGVYGIGSWTLGGGGPPLSRRDPAAGNAGRAALVQATPRDRYAHANKSRDGDSHEHRDHATKSSNSSHRAASQTDRGDHVTRGKVLSFATPRCYAGGDLASCVDDAGPDYFMSPLVHGIAS